MMASADVVTFNADQALYAVPVSRVQEILDLRPVAPMPNAPAYLLGIIGLRGANIPVVDLRRLLGRTQGEDTPQSRILVVTMLHGETQATIGIKTDRVIEVTSLDEGEIRPIEEAELLGWSGGSIAGIGRRHGEVVSVIDLDRLFSAVDVAAMTLAEAV